MESLDAQGAAIQQKSVSLNLATRTLPEALLSILTAQLPDRLPANFRALIVQDAYEEAWKQQQLAFQDFAASTLKRVDETTQNIDRKTDVALSLLERLDKAVGEGLVPLSQYDAAKTEISRLTTELQKLQETVAARESEPAEVKLSKLLAANDFAGALELKSQQVDARTREAEKLPRDLFELGTLYELNFDWLNALSAYRKAWTLEPDPEYGFKYAFLAARQNRFAEAIEAYETLRKTYTEAADIAMTLNNLAILYRETQRMKLAEDAYAEALDNYRKLAAANPEAYLPDVAMTLNNLANLYCDTQRMKLAEDSYAEALDIRRQLAAANPEAYLPYVATTLNNLANL